MATPILLDKESWNSALKYIWGQFKTWDATSLALKGKITRWRNIVLWLSIGGAILGTLSQQVDGWKIAGVPTWLAATLGVLGGAALGAASYMTKEVLSQGPEGNAVRTRAAAEAASKGALRFSLLSSLRAAFAGSQTGKADPKRYALGPLQSFATILSLALYCLSTQE